MWFLIACVADNCPAPQPMPSREVCQTVGAEYKRTMILGPKRVVCVDGETGEKIDIKER